jgi:hypothetical protein
MKKLHLIRAAESLVKAVPGARGGRGFELVCDWTFDPATRKPVGRWHAAEISEAETELPLMIHDRGRPALSLSSCRNGANQSTTVLMGPAARIRG